MFLSKTDTSLEIYTHYFLTLVGKIWMPHVSSLSLKSSVFLPSGSFPSADKLQLFLTAKEKRPSLDSLSRLTITPFVNSSLQSNNSKKLFLLLVSNYSPSISSSTWSNWTLHTQLPFGSPPSSLAIFSLSPCVHLLYSLTYKYWKAPELSPWSTLLPLQCHLHWWSHLVSWLWKQIYMLKKHTMTSPNWASPLNSRRRSNFLLGIFYSMSSVHFKL